MIIIDDSFTEIENEEYFGRKEKKLYIKDGKKYLFKYRSFNDEIISELLCEQLGKSCNIQMAHYNKAKNSSNIGIITPIFLANDEKIITSDVLKNIINGQDIKSNTIENFIKAIKIYKQNINVDEFRNELIKRWIFYTYIYESDKNDTNLAIIENSKKEIRLSPDYDNATACILNKNALNMYEELKRGKDINWFTFGIVNKLIYDESVENSFYSQFLSACNNDRLIVEKTLEQLRNIDIYSCIKKVEEENDIEISYALSFWINKALNNRLNDMESLYDESKKQRIR